MEYWIPWLELIVRLNLEKNLTIYACLDKRLIMSMLVVQSRSEIVASILRVDLVQPDLLESQTSVPEIKKFHLFYISLIFILFNKAEAKKLK